MYYIVSRRKVDAGAVDDDIRRVGVRITTPTQFLLFDILQELRREHRTLQAVAQNMGVDVDVHSNRNRNAQKQHSDGPERRSDES